MIFVRFRNNIGLYNVFFYGIVYLWNWFFNGGCDKNDKYWAKNYCGIGNKGGGV